MISPRLSDSSFPATRWSMVTRVSASGKASSVEALGELGQRYRYPVYAYVRKCGHAPDIARGITQAFLSHLHRHARDAIEPSDRGKFRRFLLDRLHAWLADDWTRLGEENGEEPAAADPELESRFAHDMDHAGSPDEAFQLGFAIEVLARALDRLAAEARETGHADMYEALVRFLGRDASPADLEHAAGTLGIKSLTVMLALKRLRSRLRELAGDELADTVASSDELAAEQQALLTILHAVK
ncbi:MAG: hypothetical protein U1F23_01365 [Lysobacterales bacterium]